MCKINATADLAPFEDLVKFHSIKIETAKLPAAVQQSAHMADSPEGNADKGGASSTANTVLAAAVGGKGDNANLDSHSSDRTNAASSPAAASIPPAENKPDTLLQTSTIEHNLGAVQQPTIPTPRIHSTKPVKTEKVGAPSAPSALNTTPASSPTPAADGDAPAAGCDTVFAPHRDASVGVNLEVSESESPLTPRIYRACREDEAAAAAEAAAEAAFLDRVTAFPGITLPKLKLTVDAGREESRRKSDRSNNTGSSTDNNNNTTMSRSAIERKPSLTSMTKDVSTAPKSKKDKDSESLLDRCVREYVCVVRQYCK